MKRQDPALCAKIESGRCLACGEGRLRIGFEKRRIFSSTTCRRQSGDLADWPAVFPAGDGLKIETLAPEAGAAQREKRRTERKRNGRAAKNHRLQEIRREALSHPLVRKILDAFPGAEVRDVRVIEASAPAAAAARRLFRNRTRRISSRPKTSDPAPGMRRIGTR